MNALSFDVEDYFQVENFSTKISPSEWDKYSLRVDRNTQKILNLLEGAGHKATFFILGWVAERCPDLVKRIVNKGHEIASHGYMHRIIYQQSKFQFKEDLIRSKELLEDIIGASVVGYRAPNFSITKQSLWAVDILRECGFEYDSSIFPISFHDRYGFEGVQRTIFRFTNGLIEIPLTVFHFMGFNFPAAGGAYFRFLPYSYFKLVFKRFNARGNYIVFYLHPWEFDTGHPVINVPFKYRIRHYFNIHKVEKRFKKLLKEFSFIPIKNLIKKEHGCTK